MKIRLSHSWPVVHYESLDFGNDHIKPIKCSLTANQGKYVCSLQSDKSASCHLKSNLSSAKSLRTRDISDNGTTFSKRADLLTIKFLLINITFYINM